MKDYITFILGPPGSGKTTYSNFLTDFYLSLNRKVIYVNLDCFNRVCIIEKVIDFKQILIGEEIMSELHIGSNSSIFFSFEYLQNNLEWLEKEMEILSKRTKNNYYFFDLPGQVELYTHHSGIKNIIQKLSKDSFTLSSLLLSDSFYWYDKTNFHMLALSNLMVIFNTAIPFFHILTKTDLMKNYNRVLTNFNEDTSNFSRNKRKNIFSWSDKLKFSIDDVILDFGMVNPTPINLTKNTQLLNLVKHIERFT